MKNKFIIAALLVFLCACILASCQADKSGKIPRWVRTGETSKYPPSQYLIGIGSARDTGRPDEDRAAADESARINLASQIKVKVDSELSTRVAEQSKYSEEASRTQGTQEVESLIRSRVDMELTGVEFVDRHFDSGKKTYYTLAVLDRSRTSAELKKEIKKLRDEGKHYYSEAEKLADSGELRDALRALNRSLGALADAEAKETVVSVIGGSPVSPDQEGLNPWQVGARIEEVRSRLRYLIKIYETNPFSENSDLVASALVTRLNELGLNAVHAGDAFSGLSYREVINAPAEYLSEQVGDKVCFLIVGEVEAMKSSRTRIGKNPFFFYKSRADVKMINVLTGKVISTVAFDWEEMTKVGRSRQEQAAALSLEKAGDLIAGRLVEQMENYLYPGGDQWTEE